jgi:hypothetical protein
MQLDTSQRLPQLFFTKAGLAELCAMMADGRLADPKNLLMSAGNSGSIGPTDLTSHGFGYALWNHAS